MRISTTNSVYVQITFGQLNKLCIVIKVKIASSLLYHLNFQKSSVVKIIPNQ